MVNEGINAAKPHTGKGVGGLSSDRPTDREKRRNQIPANQSGVAAGGWGWEVGAGRAAA